MDKLGKINKPATIVDKHGKLLVWHLPNIFCPGRMVCFPQADRFLDIFMVCLQAKFNCAVMGLRMVLEEKSGKPPTW